MYLGPRLTSVGEDSFDPTQRSSVPSNGSLQQHSEKKQPICLFITAVYLNHFNWKSHSLLTIQSLHCMILTTVTVNMSEMSTYH